MKRVALGLVTAIIALLPGMSAAGADPSATISSTTLQPGDTVEVRAEGLRPGAQAVVDCLPDGVRFGIPTVEADGTVGLAVRIPPTSYDGPKQIQIRSLGANGRYVRLAIDLTIAGIHATARLGSDHLRPSQRVAIAGEHFFPSTDVLVVLYPERVVLLRERAGEDGVLSSSFVMPAQLLNGPHGVVLGARSSGASAAFIKMRATVSGGVGSVPEDEDVLAGVTQGGLPTAGTTPTSAPMVPLTTGASSTTSVTSPTPPTIPRSAEDATTPVAVGLGVLALLVILAVVISGRRSPRSRISTFR
jgi:hypothetical protein